MYLYDMSMTHDHTILLDFLGLLVYDCCVVVWLFLIGRHHLGNELDPSMDSGSFAMGTTSSEDWAASVPQALMPFIVTAIRLYRPPGKEKWSWFYFSSVVLIPVLSLPHPLPHPTYFQKDSLIVKRAHVNGDTVENSIHNILIHKSFQR